MKKTILKYVRLFLSTLYLSAFTFGGGYVIVPLMRKKFVDNLKWINENEMLDFVAIAQSSPGPLAINTSIMVGFSVGSFLGALIALIGTALPPLIVISLVSLVYNFFIENSIIAAVLKGMNIAVAAIILSVVINMAKDILKTKSAFAIAILAFSFVASYAFEVSAIYVILVGAALGLGSMFLSMITYKIKQKKKGGGKNDSITS